jgi:hypothetical protein
VAPPPLGSNTNPGTEELPFATIQHGIDAAADADTVIVAEGTYVENVRFNGKNIVLRSTDPLDPTIVANTVIDGNQAGSVVTFSGTETEACVLSGFTIRNGTAQYGGGILGGSYPDYTHATIQNNTVTGNSATVQGGALSGCAGTIQNNTITTNSARAGGGLFFCNGVIRNNAITGNSATSWDGGGLLRCAGTIQNNTITGNSAVRNGGGLHDCGGNIENNSIAANSARYGGGLYWCNGTIQNNTITANSATNGGGLDQCNGTICNCIIWANTAPFDGQLSESSIPSFSCIEGWTEGGEGNIASEPRFVDANACDYHLQQESRCIDAGVNGYWFPWPQRDLDGNCRLVGLAVDMGCYEYGSSKDADGDLLSDADESAARTDPLRDDSDGDGLRDGLEVLRGSNPIQLTPPGILNVPSDFATIQQSLSVAMTGDEIIVAPGAYQGNIQFCGPDIILRSWDPEDQSIVSSTILDGGGAGPVVSFAGGESEACVLAGFTIRNGKALHAAGVDGGGAHATIQNNTITENAATWGGGLAYCDGLIQNNTITANCAHEDGGGLYLCNGTIHNNTITGNSATYGGGLAKCDGTVQSNAIAGNSAQEYGGGLMWCSGTVQSNTITGNSATHGGGLSDCHGTLQNNTIAGNLAQESGAGLDSCSSTIRNCIIWGNGAPTDPQLSDSSIPTYSCIEGWDGGGEGNISEDPQFVDPDGPDDNPDTPDDNDFRLTAESPCIDKGENDDWMIRAVDLDGNPRIWNRTADIGAHEYGSWPFKICEVLQEPGGALKLTWTSRLDDEYVIRSCTDLTSGAWTQEQTLASAGDSTCWTDPNPGGSQKFYRVELQ